MADPLPPSYNEAITGDFSALLPPSTSPPPPESSPPPTFNGEETRSIDTRQHQAQTESYFDTADPDVDTNRSPRCRGRSKKFWWWLVSVIVTAALIPIVIHFNLLPEHHLVTKAKYKSKLRNARNCKREPPRENHRGVKWSPCPKNYQGNYDNGTKCTVECQDGLFMHVYNYRGYPIKDSENIPAHYTCLETKWVYSMAEYSREFQCLPKSDSAEDCELNELEKEISGTSKPPTIKDCPHNYRPGRYYFSGTKCTVGCPRTYSLYVQNSANKLEKGPKSVEYTCQNSTWVSSLNGGNTIKECFRSFASEAGLDCEDSLGIPLKDCLQNHRGGYFQGTKCNVECQENSTLYAYGNNSLTNFDENAVLEPISTKVKATCKLGKFSYHSKYSVWTFSSADGSSKRKYERVQCLPPSNDSKDCLKLPDYRKDIKLDENEHGMFYCPINERGVYSEGTLCIWQCKSGYVLYNRKLRTLRLPNIISSFHWTCEDSRWTSSISREFRKGFLYCVKRNKM